MRRSAFALVAVTCAFAPVSCVEVTTARKGEPAADTQSGGQSKNPKSKVRVYAWNPLDGVYDVVSFPFKAVGRAAKKIF
ncbi:MAG: hypothetical protein WCP22_06300 [Chlamydiota bacterium]